VELTLTFDGKPFKSEQGLKRTCSKKNLSGDILYPIIHLEGEDIEIAFNPRVPHYGEEYYSFLNGQHTNDGRHPCQQAVPR